MPLLDYVCEDGHTDERLVRADRSNAPQTCTRLVKEADGAPRDGDATWRVCGKPVREQLAAPASIFPGAAGWRGK